MWSDRLPNPGPLALESDLLPNNTSARQFCWSLNVGFFISPFITLRKLRLTDTVAIQTCSKENSVHREGMFDFNANVLCVFYLLLQNN